MRGAVLVAGPAGQVRAHHGGPGAGALNGGGVDQVHVVGVDAGGGGQCGCQPPDSAGQGAQSLVVAGLARDVGEHASQVLAGVAQEASFGVDAHQRCDGGQGQDLGVGDGRGDPHPRAGRGDLGVGLQQVVSGDVQCSGEGLQVGVHFLKLPARGNGSSSTDPAGPSPPPQAPTPTHTPLESII